jgi:hypothetical protein
LRQKPGPRPKTQPPATPLASDYTARMNYVVYDEDGYRLFELHTAQAVAGPRVGDVISAGPKTYRVLERIWVGRCEQEKHVVCDWTPRLMVKEESPP